MNMQNINRQRYIIGKMVCSSAIGIGNINDDDDDARLGVYGTV